MSPLRPEAIDRIYHGPELFKAECDALAKTFRCPDPTGAKAPCDKRTLEIPVESKIYNVGQTMRCPVAKRINCEPFKRYEAAEIERDRQVWRDRGMPERHIDATLERLGPSPAVSRVRQYLASEIQQGLCLVFQGGVGTGKTAAACAALHAMGRGNFFYVPNLFGLMIRRPDYVQDVFESKNLVVVDDLGAEYAKPGGMLESKLDELFTTREANYLPTIVTTNVPLPRFMSEISPRIADRLLGPWGRGCSVKNPSFRTAT